MEVENSMCDRILRTIENVISSDRNLNEFGIIPTEGNTRNKSPVLYTEHNLGVESWCIKYILKYASAQLFSHREQLSNKKLLYSKINEVNRYLMGALLLNPDVTTFWNMKRQLVELDVLNCDSELYFSRLVLTHKSKSNETFAYRRWLLQRKLKIHIDPNQHEELFRNELSVVTMAAEKTQNNYHAWTHRIWCLENIVMKSPILNQILCEELDSSYQFIIKHVSEHSGYHYRQYLLKVIIDCKIINNICSKDVYSIVLEKFGLSSQEGGTPLLTFLFGDADTSKILEKSNHLESCMALLLCEYLFLIDGINYTYPGHETIWYYRKMLLYQLLKMSHETLGVEFKLSSKLNKSETETIFPLAVNNIDRPEDVCHLIESGGKKPKRNSNKVELAVLYDIILKTESKFLSDAMNSKNSLQIYFAKRYENWCRMILNLNNL